MNREAEKRASFRREQKARMRVENPERARREDNASLARSRATSRLVAAYRAEFDSYVVEELEKLEVRRPAVSGQERGYGYAAVAAAMRELETTRAALARVEQLATRWESSSMAVSGDDGHEGTAALAVARAFAAELRAALAKAEATAS